MNRRLLISLSVCFISAGAFADTGVMNNSSLSNSCNINFLGVVSGTAVMVPNFEISTYLCNPGYYLPADGVECTVCPNDNYCVGGAFHYDPETAQGIHACPNSWNSPSGMHELESCGRILHIGSEVIYLRSAKKTNPSLNVDINNDGVPEFFGNMTLADVPMNSQTERKLKINNTSLDATYSVYDDSVNVSSGNSGD